MTTTEPDLSPDRTSAVEPSAGSARRRAAADVVGLAARLALGGVLVYAGAIKVGTPLTSARAVQAYEVMPMEVATWVGYALPFVEIILGALLIVGLLTRGVALVSTALMVIFVIGIAQAWARGLTIDCGCFGGGGQIDAADTEYPTAIARDLAFALMGAWLVRRPRSPLSADRALFG